MGSNTQPRGQASGEAISRVNPNRPPSGSNSNSSAGIQQAPGLSGWLSANLAKVVVGVMLLALVGGIVAVALGNRTPAVAENPPSFGGGTTNPGVPVTGVDPSAGLAIDGAGALTEAVSAAVIIDLYSDFACPFCAHFDQGYGEQLLELAADPNFSVRLHPVSVLDRTTDGTGFSTLAGAILLEVAATSPQYVWAMNDLLLSNQEALRDMSGTELVDFLAGTGLSLPSIGEITASRGPLLAEFTNAFRNTGAQGVPLLLINGQQWSPGQTPWPNNSLIDAAHAALG